MALGDRRPHAHVVLAGGRMDRLAGLGAVDLPRSHRGAGAKLRVVLLAHEALGVENAIEHQHPRLTAQETVGLEESHLFAEVGFSQILALDRRFDAWERRPSVAGAESSHRGDPNVAILIDDS